MPPGARTSTDWPPSGLLPSPRAGQAVQRERAPVEHGDPRGDLYTKTRCPDVVAGYLKRPDTPTRPGTWAASGGGLALAPGGPGHPPRRLGDRPGITRFRELTSPGWDAPRVTGPQGDVIRRAPPAQPLPGETASRAP
jgi:hypothetical protein